MFIVSGKEVMRMFQAISIIVVYVTRLVGRYTYINNTYLKMTEIILQHQYKLRI